MKRIKKYQNLLGLLSDIFHLFAKENIPSLIPSSKNNLPCVKFHKNDCTSHTSKSTVILLDKMTNKSGIAAI